MWFFIDSFEFQIMEIDKSGPITVLIQVCYISKIQLVVYYQCCFLIGWATTRLYVIAH